MDDRLALSTLDWWQEAGVDTLVDELPRDWLARAAPREAAIEAAPAASASPAATLPGDLAAFRAWLLADAAVPGPASARIDAAGDPASGTMILVDMPEAEDRAARRLLSGDVGALFDRMLGAAGLARETIYLAALAPGRPAAGRIDAAMLERLVPLARHHVALVRPRRLLLMGDAPARALAGGAIGEARGRVHPLDLDGVAVSAVATFAPRKLVDAREQKKAAWADLQRFMAL